MGLVDRRRIFRKSSGTFLNTHGLNQRRARLLWLKSRTLRSKRGIIAMLKTVCGFAGIVVISFYLFPGLSPQVEARSQVPSEKSDRLDARPLGSECSQSEWPYFEASCLRNPRNRLGRAREVPIVSADRQCDCW
jgi:hypothetical protein